MVRKLKVFQARIGFYETVVAAASQAAALQAWGMHRNLFADGTASQATGDEAIEAALQQPGVVLKRAIGTSEPFGLNPGVPQMPDVPKGAPRPKAKPRGAARASKPKPATKARPPPDRSALDKAEAALASLDEERSRDEQALRQDLQTLEAEEREIARRRRELQGRADAAEKRHHAARLKAERAVEQARTAYERAGGR